MFITIWLKQRYAANKTIYFYTSSNAALLVAVVGAAHGVVAAELAGLTAEAVAGDAVAILVAVAGGFAAVQEIALLVAVVRATHGVVAAELFLVDFVILHFGRDLNAGKKL
jgi:purine-cytosine permease-like protein